VASSEQFNILSSPFLAIMQADLSNLFKSKLTYGWLIAGLFLVVIRVLSSRVGGTMSSTVAAGFSDFLLIWSMIIIGLTASAVSSEAGEFADSIMSKSVTRFDYIFAKFASRILYVLTIFGAISLISTGLSWKLLSNDYQTYGFIYSILLIILILTTLTTIGVALSTVAPNTIIAIISLLIIWYFMVFFFPLADLGFLSPSTIANELPNNIQGIWSIDTWQTVTGFAAISIAATSLSAIYFFFKDV
jgi:ABC-type transport system involved in multi-copper enzyme maturation permease subunit